MTYVHAKQEIRPTHTKKDVSIPMEIQDLMFVTHFRMIVKNGMIWISMESEIMQMPLTLILPNILMWMVMVMEITPMEPKEIGSL